MSKIDTSTIEGYDEMSAEDKLKALEGYEIPEPDYSGYVKKDVFDKTSHDLSEAKKELKAKLSEDEQKKLEAETATKELNEKYEALLRKSTISDNKAKYLALGYDEKLAEETATAVADGDTEKVFANEKKHLEQFEKKIRADALKRTPKPEGGTGSDTMTLDKFRGLSPADRLKYSEEHPEEYKSLYSNGGNA